VRLGGLPLRNQAETVVVFITPTRLKRPKEGGIGCWMRPFANISGQKSTRLRDHP
jgi:hypothetical protein